jgi:hypothetical protein
MSSKAVSSIVSTVARSRGKRNRDCPKNDSDEHTSVVQVISLVFGFQSHVEPLSFMNWISSG